MDIFFLAILISIVVKYIGKWGWIYVSSRKGIRDVELLQTMFESLYIIGLTCSIVGMTILAALAVKTHFLD